MAKYMRESLVQSGVSVRMDVKAIGARRGAPYLANLQAPPISLIPNLFFPCRAGDFDPQRRLNHATNERMEQAASGTGRSLGRTVSRSAARSAAQAVPSGIAWNNRGCKPMTAKRLGQCAYRGTSLGSGIPGLSAG